LSRGFDDHDPERPKSRPAGGRRPFPQGQGSGERIRGPKPLTDILGDLFAARGLARVQATGELQTAWVAAVGEPGCRHTKVEGLRRGILSVTVAHPTLLAELSSFQKPTLLAALRRLMAGTPIHDIRFRVGPIDDGGTSDPPNSPPRPGRRQG